MIQFFAGNYNSVSRNLGQREPPEMEKSKEEARGLQLWDGLYRRDGMILSGESAIRGIDSGEQAPVSL